MTKIAIIGTDLCGLSVAHFLKDHAKITLFEKALGVSGPMSTRRAGIYFFDHGAQYFTARKKVFHDFIQPLISEGIIQRWNVRYVKFDGDQIIERKKWIDDEPRYVGVPSMNKIAKHMAEGLNVHINTRVISIKRDDTWQLTDKSGQLYNNFDWVISTVPATQATEFLPKTFKYYDHIKDIKCLPVFRLCWVLLKNFHSNLRLHMS